VTPAHIVQKKLAYVTAFAFKDASIPPAPPLPTTSEITAAVAFSFLTPSPLVLGAIPVGYKFNRVAMLIETPFDDPIAAVTLGTSADTGLLLGVADVRPGDAGQYDNDALITIQTSDVLLLTIHPGSSAQGAGLLLYKVLPP
jgi:hypothetical protein